MSEKGKRAPPLRKSLKSAEAGASAGAELQLVVNQPSNAAETEDDAVHSQANVSFSKVSFRSVQRVLLTHHHLTRLSCREILKCVLCVVNSSQ